MEKLTTFVCFNPGLSSWKLTTCADVVTVGVGWGAVDMDSVNEK